ncbi:hypothetical protein ACFCWY_08675 [Streptomyces sp. NPDC056362]|uniref:hypothetical protein n=1 Tax=unclassified Streptomyces TaxID=2593676 RepID=UPI0035E2D5AF
MHTISLSIDLTQLPSADLLQLHRATRNELAARNAAALPGHVLAALKGTLLDVEIPRLCLAEFFTMEGDEGHSWNPHEVYVSFDDGSSRTLDLSEHSPLGDALTDHAGWHDQTIGDDSRLHFAPGLPTLIYKS